MIIHRIIWTLKDELTDQEKNNVREHAKRELEGLLGQIEGLISIRVEICPLPSSNGDMMLDSAFESAEALKNYASHPAHVHVANTYVRPYTASRACIDYEIQSDNG